MLKVRLVFSKLGFAKYVSHLDLMRLFQRVFRRAEIDIAFSQGFNPHPKMTIGHPIPLGVTASEEYLDLFLNEECDLKTMRARLNSALPPDIRITDIYVPKEALNLLVWADYTVELEVKKPLPDFCDYIAALHKKEDIVVAKKTKRAITNTDIKPMIKTFDVLEHTDTYFRLHLLLSCKENANLKAITVIDAMKKYIPDFEVDHLLIHRNGLYKENMTKIS